MIHPIYYPHHVSVACSQTIKIAESPPNPCVAELMFLDSEANVLGNQV